MPTVAVKPTRVATDWLDGVSLRDWWKLDVFMSVSPSVAKNTVMTYLSLHLIANKTVELVYENAPKCTILKWKKFKKIRGRGHSRWGGEYPLPEPLPFSAWILASSALEPHCFFDKSNTETKRHYHVKLRQNLTNVSNKTRFPFSQRERPHVNKLYRPPF